MCSKMLQASTAHEVRHPCFQYEVEVTFDVTMVSVRRETLEQDGARHGVHGYVCELFVAENLPSATKSFATTRACKSL